MYPYVVHVYGEREDQSLRLSDLLALAISRGMSGHTYARRCLRMPFRHAVRCSNGRDVIKRWRFMNVECGMLLVRIRVARLYVLSSFSMR